MSTHASEPEAVDRLKALAGKQVVYRAHGTGDSHRVTGFPDHLPIRVPYSVEVRGECKGWEVRRSLGFADEEWIDIAGYGRVDARGVTLAENSLEDPRMTGRPGFSWPNYVASAAASCGTFGLVLAVIAALAESDFVMDWAFNLIFAGIALLVTAFVGTAVARRR